MIRALLDSESGYLKGITLDRLEREGSVRLNVSRDGEPFLPFANGGFRTPSGKFEFGAESLNYTPPQESRFGDAARVARYPLELISAKNDNSMNSTFGHRDGVDEETSELSLHADDAAARGIGAGALVRAWNDRGACYFIAKISADTAPGVVRARSVRWNKRSLCGFGTNRLTTDRLDRLRRWTHLL